ncbi:hypothetical protein [Agrobacterium radiobacter]|uniref:hypothetical protein n=1 Tax=Agrobacterium radiobacter TaxID=362 RepID=UPI003F83413E
MILADPNTKLGRISGAVDMLKPGECLAFDMRELADIRSFEHNGATFSPADRVLGNIMGSAYTHSFSVTDYGRTVVFYRHEETGERRYKEPDHDIRLSTSFARRENK